MITEKRIRLHTFNGIVAVSSDNTEQLYLDPENAIALAKELIRYANGCKEGVTYATRNVENGKATNESDGKKRAKVI